MSLAPAPEKLVEDGRQTLGRFGGPARSNNLIDGGYRGWPRPLRWWRLKEWQAVQVASPRLFANVALFDARLMQLRQVKVYDRARGKKHIHESKLRPRSMRQPRRGSLVSSRSACSMRSATTPSRTTDIRCA